MNNTPLYDYPTLSTLLFLYHINISVSVMYGSTIELVLPKKIVGIVIYERNENSEDLAEFLS
mgnify:CR=1 FL=1